MDPKHLAVEASIALGMLVSQHVKRAVDGQPHELFVQGNGHFLGLTNGLIEAHVDITEHRLASFVESERDDIGGPIPPEVLTIQITDGLVCE